MLRAKFVSTIRMLSLTVLIVCLSNISLSAAALEPISSNSFLANLPIGYVSSKLKVPQALQTGYFSQDRYLNLPPGFAIEVMARIDRARFMLVLPNGDILVSQPANGKIILLRPNANDSPTLSDFATDLRAPHDMVLHQIDNVNYLYISETNQINRYVYKAGDTTAHDRQVVVTGLPDASNPELGGAYGHPLKNIALDSKHKLYVAIASTCNACMSDTVSNPKRGAIYQYDADGKNGRLFAQGLRNAEGLAFAPGTDELWVVVNNRDNTAMPDPTSPYYKQVVTAYVDNHPPEEFTRVRDGGNYGWPFCNPNPDSPTGYDNMPFDRDVQFNENGQVDCNAMDRINKGIQGHSAPLGLTFLQDTNFPQIYRNGAITALHGSWNRSKKSGYTLAYFAWNNQTPGSQIDFVSGWLEDKTQTVWGRPVDVAVDPQGNLLISDDYAGAIYKMTYAPPNPPNPPNAPISFDSPAFERTWRRTDQQVRNGTVSRTYFWGATPFSEGLHEPYVESPNNSRQVQYFDKTRMEINQPDAAQTSPYYVSNGLLVKELISGRLQIGDNKFEDKGGALVGVAGDPDDTSGPTYKALANLTNRTTDTTGQVISHAVNREGVIREAKDEFKTQVKFGGFVDNTGHNIAAPFWDFLEQTGPILSPIGTTTTGRLFDPLFYATGYPITEPYWARVKVGGVEKEVLIQAFERRVLTYTPANSADFKVEMGNVGQHYYKWRYNR